MRDEQLSPQRRTLHSMRRWFYFWRPLGAFYGIALAILFLGVAEAQQAGEAPESDAASTDRSPEALKIERARLQSEAEELRAAGQFAAAAAAGEQMLVIERQWLGEDSEDVARSLEWLAATYQEAEDFPAAERKGVEALAWRENRQGASHWQTIDARLNLDDIRQRRLLTDVLRQRLREAYAAVEEASRLASQGKYADALPLAQRAEAVYLEVFGATHRNYAASLVWVAHLYDNLGHYARAAPLYRQALAILKEVLGERHPDYATSFNHLALLYQSMGDYARAAPLFLRASEIYKEVLGEKHPYYATSLDNLASLYDSMGNYARAEPLLRQALEIRKEVLGEKHTEYATSLNNLARLYHRMGDYARAELLCREALEIYKGVLGETHPVYATSLSYLATVYASMGDYARAEPLHRQALEIHKEVLGEKHPQYATSLDNLASLYASMGDYARAEPLYRQALEIRKEVRGEKHPDYATSLNNLASLYDSMGDYARAEPLHRQALEINKEVLGEKHSLYARSLSHLALLYHSMGDYARAEPLFRQALEIEKEVLGDKHPGYAASLHNMALLYFSMGDYARAEPLLRQALEINKEVLGEKHPHYAQSLSGLAELYRTMGDYARAEPLFRQAVEIRKEVLGEKHPDYATSLNNLATLYVSMGDYAPAEPLLQQALEIRKEVLGEKHPHYATSLNNLAELYRTMGNYARAEPLHRQGLEINKEVLGEKHPLYATSLNNLALLHFSKGDYARAEPLYRQALEIISSHIELTAAVQSERQQLAMADDGRFCLSNFVSCVLQTGTGAGDSYAQVLGWKGAVLARQRHARQRTDADEPDEVRKLRAELQAVAVRLATLALATPPPEQSAAWRGQLAELTQSKETLEAELSRHSAEFRRLAAEKELTADQLRATLPMGSALVDLLEYSREIVKPQEQGPPKRHWEQRLAAFVLRADRPVVIIDLGPSEPINKAIGNWRQQIGEFSNELKETGLLLRQLVWEPLEGPLKDCPTVLISPDGALARIPWGALPGSQPETYLLEERTIVVVAAPQLLPGLLETRADELNKPSLLVAGDVDYGAQPGQATLLADARSAPRGMNEREGLRGLWSPLSATRPEIRDVESSFHHAFQAAEVTQLRTDGATEEAFRQQAVKHRFLHLATHGFFAPAELQSALAPNKAGDHALDRADLFGQRSVVGFHPGLLSGIVLAGANLPPAPDQDDGILTALEVGSLDLRNVDLVTLSACETGLGEVAGGEGILGLQRAFQIAGARTTVASLWKVHDDATRALMTEFYKNLWEKKLPRIEALRQAQLTMLNRYDSKSRTLRSSGELVKLDPEKRAQSRREGANAAASRTPPVYWAAFVLSGDWR